MLHALKERKRTMRSERKRMRCPTLVAVAFLLVGGDRLNPAFLLAGEDQLNPAFLLAGGDHVVKSNFPIGGCRSVAKREQVEINTTH